MAITSLYVCVSFCVSVFVKDSTERKREQDRVREKGRREGEGGGDFTRIQTKAASSTSELYDRGSLRCSLADGQVA